LKYLIEREGLKIQKIVDKIKKIKEEVENFAKV
jgi:hypothetical protein